MDLFLIAQKSIADDSPEQDQLYGVGTVARILQVLKLPDGTRKVLVQGIARAQMSAFFHHEEDHYSFEFERVKIMGISDTENTTLIRMLREKFEKYVKNSEGISPEVLNSLRVIKNAEELADGITMHLTNLSIEEKQSVLSIVDIAMRVEQLVVFISRELEWKKIEKNINTKVRRAMEEDQEAYFNEKTLKSYSIRVRR